MKKRPDEILEFEKLLEESKVKRPLNKSEKRAQRRSKRKMYLRILKTVGAYTLFSSLLTALYYGVKRVSAFFAGLTTAKIISMLTVISVTIALTYYNFDDKEEQTAQIKNTQKQNTEPIVQDTPKPRKKIFYKLLIKPLKTTSADPQELKNTSRYFLKNFKSMRGKEFATLLKNSTFEPQYAMYASLEKLDAELVILVKVINTKTSAIVFVSKKITTGNELNQACAELARQISNKIK